MSITVGVDSSVLLDYLGDLLAKCHNLTPLMRGIGMELENRVRARFETQTDPLGHPWAAWKPSTVATYPKDGNGTILDRHGDMLRSLSSTADDGSATIGFGKDYATFHEWGTKTMPRRGLLMADPEEGTLGAADATAVLDLVQTYLLS